MKTAKIKFATASSLYPLFDLIIINFVFLFLWGLQTESLPFWSRIDPHSKNALFLLNVIFAGAFTAAGAYRKLFRSSLAYRLITLIQGSLLSIILLISLFAATDLPLPSGFFLPVYMGATLIFLAAFRIIMKDVENFLKNKGIGRYRTLLSGLSDDTINIFQRIENNPDLAYDVTGFLAMEQEYDLSRLRKNFGINLPVYTLSDDWEEIFEKEKPDKVLLPMTESVHNRLPVGFINFCSRKGVEVKEAAPPNRIRVGETRVQDILGVPLVIQKSRNLRRINERVKRIIDFCLSFIAVVLLSPLLALIAAAVKLDSPGPVFFLQKRLTKNEREFNIVKFRSMFRDAEQRLEKYKKLNEAQGPIFKIKKDPRITRVGAVLRRLSLDELPQLFNVIKGDLSLVGPRPPIPEEVEKYEPWHKKRLQVVQGMTGLWQISGRSDLNFEEMVLLDIYYIENWSILLDIEIILDTIPSVISARGAY